MKYATKFMMVPYVKPYDIDVKRDKQQSLDNEMSTILSDDSITPGVRLQKYYDSLSKLNSFNPTGSKPNDASLKIEPEISDPILKTLNKILELLQPKDEAAQTSQLFVKKLSDVSNIITAKPPPFTFNPPPNKFDSSTYNFNSATFDPNTSRTTSNNQQSHEPKTPARNEARTTELERTTSRDKTSDNDDDTNISNLFDQSDTSNRPQMSVNDTNNDFKLPAMTNEVTVVTEEKPQKGSNWLPNLFNLGQNLWSGTTEHHMSQDHVEKQRQVRAQQETLMAEQAAFLKRQQAALEANRNRVKQELDVSAIHGSTEHDTAILDDSSILDETTVGKGPIEPEQKASPPKEIRARDPLRPSGYSEQQQQSSNPADDELSKLLESAYSTGRRMSARDKRPVKRLINE
jgi:hypothetical protein